MSPSKLPKEQIRKFQELYLTYYGIQLTEDEAMIEGMQLIELVKMVYKPITKSQVEALSNKKKGV